MRAYLKIENPGVCPPEGFTVLGVSLANTSNHDGVIGQFGSGNKHSIALLLRNEVCPIVFSGKLRMDFATREQTVSDGVANKDFRRVQVKYSGTRSGTEELGFVLDFGKIDWQGVEMALREFVSNAIDRCIRENGDWSKVVIEVVNENQVRAKADHTRIFIPLTEEVLGFYNNIGKWFLHFSEPESLGRAILPKTNRNISSRKAAVIYRRGVRVREFEASDSESLFDYNLDQLTVDEARVASDWSAKHECAKALANADTSILSKFFERVLSNDSTPAWELSFDAYSLTPNYCDTTEQINKRREAWQMAFEAIAGTDAVMAAKGSNIERLTKKGYKAICVPEGLMSAAEAYGLKTPHRVLTLDESEGRVIKEPTAEFSEAVEAVWGWIEDAEMTRGKDIPDIKIFSSQMDGCTVTNGFYRQGTVYLNENLGPGHEMQAVALEELAHYVTEATDNSRDFQQYLVDLIVRTQTLSAATN